VDQHNVDGMERAGRRTWSTRPTQSVGLHYGSRPRTIGNGVYDLAERCRRHRTLRTSRLENGGERIRDRKNDIVAPTCTKYRPVECRQHRIRSTAWTGIIVSMGQLANSSVRGSVRTRVDYGLT
jgi:hypothetical protein